MQDSLMKGPNPERFLPVLRARLPRVAPALFTGEGGQRLDLGLWPANRGQHDDAHQHRWLGDAQLRQCSDIGRDL